MARTLIEELEMEVSIRDREDALRAKRKRTVAECGNLLVSVAEEHLGDVSLLQVNACGTNIPFKASCSTDGEYFHYTISAVDCNGKTQRAESLRVSTNHEATQLWSKHLSSDTTRYPNREVFVEQLDLMMRYLFKHCTTESLKAYLSYKKVKEVYSFKCAECGHTGNFIATAVTYQRVIVNQAVDIEEALDCPDYSFTDFACEKCGGTGVIGGNL